MSVKIKNLIFSFRSKFRLFPSVFTCFFAVMGIIYPLQLPNNVSLMRIYEKNAKKIGTAGRPS